MMIVTTAMLMLLVCPGLFGLECGDDHPPKPGPVWERGVFRYLLGNRELKGKGKKRKRWGMGKRAGKRQPHATVVPVLDDDLARRAVNICSFLDYMS
jgi:hypothetical protein